MKEIEEQIQTIQAGPTKTRSAIHADVVSEQELCLLRRVDPRKYLCRPVVSCLGRRMRNLSSPHHSDIAPRGLKMSSTFICNSTS